MNVYSPLLVSKSMSSAKTPDDVIVLLVAERVAGREELRRELSDVASVGVYYCADPLLVPQTVESIAPTVILHWAAANDALASVKRYRAHAGTRDIPIVVFAASDERAEAAAIFAAGASDFLTSAPGERELIARLRHHSAAYVAHKRAAEAYAALRESKASLLKKIGELERLCSVDGLTGLSNRRYFDDFTAMQWKLAIRERLPFSILMIDVDDFKRYNDTYGHLAGDKALQAVGDALKRCCQRPLDLVARFGGEEFVICLRAPLEGASRVGERLCRVVEQLRIPHAGSTIGGRLTISIGGASALPSQGDAYLPLVDAADKALYEAKSAGKNRAVFREREAALATPHEPRLW